jgi:hypothetical protein
MVFETRAARLASARDGADRCDILLRFRNSRPVPIME